MSTTTKRLVPFFDPRSISGCQLWLDSADRNSVILSGSSVTQWRDKSGNGNHASGGVSPTYSNNGIVFNGSSFLSLPTISASSNNASYFIVFRRSSTPGAGSAYALLGGTDLNSFVIFIDSASRLIVSDWNVNVIILPSVTINNATTYLTTALTNGSVKSLGLDGSSLTQGTATFSGTRTMTIGAGYTDNRFKLVGSIFEIISFTRQVTTQEQQQVEGYLAWKWNLLSSFPQSHPSRRSPLMPVPPSSLPTGTVNNKVALYFDPRSISGCQLWLDAEDPSTLTLTSNTRVIGWRDKAKGMTLGQVVNGVTAPNYSNAERGIYFTNPTNGVFTSNVTQGLGIVNPPISVNFTQQSHFTVIQPLGGTSGYAQVFRINSASGPTFGFTALNANAFPSEVVADNYAINIQTSASYLTTRHIRSFNIQSNGHFIFLNGTQGGVGSVNYSSSNTPALTTLSLGGHNDNRSYSGFIFESIYYNRILTLQERQLVEGYLAHKWGLQINLPPTHPFRNGPPSAFPQLTLPIRREKSAFTVFLNSFSFTGSNQSFVVPTGISSAQVFLWGAGGGGGLGGNGGAGCFVQGILPIIPGETLTIVVGQGGANKNRNFPRPYGGGGRGGGPDNGRSDIPAGQGGGRSAIVRSGSDIVTAGSGGGGRGGNGGRGGLINGFQGGGAAPIAGGGTQSAGGISNQAGGVGALATGGDANQDNSSGGGSGFYGGGGAGQDRPGGGGSSLVSNLTLIPGQTTFGTESSNGIVAPQTSSPFYRVDVGFGGTTGQGFGYGSGGNGLVIIGFPSLNAVVTTNTPVALRIIEAWYGSVVYRFGSSVTSTVNTAYNNNPSNTITLGSPTFVDPQPGVTKFTFFVYTINGLQKYATFANNTVLTFSSLT